MIRQHGQTQKGLIILIFRSSFFFFALIALEITSWVTQVGIGHNFHLNATGWKWKLSTCLGGDGISQIRNKSKISMFPGFDLRIGWKAEYVLPEIHG